jgi:alkylation response protein AidB-like acyl-CoA dehydrogenase
VDLQAPLVDQVQARKHATRDVSGTVAQRDDGFDDVLDGRLDDHAVAYRLGRAFARIEAAQSTPGIFGRVAIAQTMRDVAPELMDVLGPAAGLTTDSRGSVAGGGPEYLYRWAPLIGIYGGTIDVFRNMIAQYMLGLGRPSYSPPKRQPR